MCGLMSAQPPIGRVAPTRRAVTNPADWDNPPYNFAGCGRFVKSPLPLGRAGRAALIKRPRDRCGRNAQDARFTRPIPIEPCGFVGFRVPRRRLFVSGEAAKPAGGGGDAATGETKSQARAWLPRRNRRQAIRRARPLSWSRVCAKPSNFQTYHADGVHGRAYAPCHKNL